MIRMRMAKIVGALLVASMCFLGQSQKASAQKRGFKQELSSLFTRTNPSFAAAFRPVISKINASTVRVQSEGKDLALGCVVDADGWILTKASDLKEPLSVKLKDGREYSARWMGLHEPHDLALLKIDAKGLTPVEWCDSKCAEVGNWVVCVGQSDDPIAFGVVGVATRMLPPTAINPGYLGVQLEPAEGGVKVTQILANTPATKAGIVVNDVVLVLGGSSVPDPDAFMSAIQRFRPGDDVTLKVKRGDSEMELKATLGGRPTNSRGDFQNALGSELSQRKTGFTSVLQHDSVVKPSECGGPLCDLEGRVIGLNICRKGRTESWAVPAESIRPILKDLIGGKFPPPKVATIPIKTQDPAMEQTDAPKQDKEKSSAEFEAAYNTPIKNSPEILPCRFVSSISTAPFCPAAAPARQR